MNEKRRASRAAPIPMAAARGAVISMLVGVFALAAAEFLPPSVLTPIASDLSISVGPAGQTVTVTAALAFAGSLLIPSLTRRMHRRNVLLGLAVLLIVSSLMVAFAPDFALLLLGRALLGVALGGFWAMSIAIVMRLVPESPVPRGLAIVMSGLGAATIMATPVGSWLGAVIGWRGVFLLAATLGLLRVLALISRSCNRWLQAGPVDSAATAAWSNEAEYDDNRRDQEKRCGQTCETST